MLLKSLREFTSSKLFKKPYAPLDLDSLFRLEALCLQPLGQADRHALGERMSQLSVWARPSLLDSLRCDRLNLPSLSYPFNLPFPVCVRESLKLR